MQRLGATRPPTPANGLGARLGREGTGIALIARDGGSAFRRRPCRQARQAMNDIRRTQVLGCVQWIMKSLYCRWCGMARVGKTCMLLLQAQLTDIYRCCLHLAR